MRGRERSVGVSLERAEGDENKIPAVRNCLCLAFLMFKHNTVIWK